MKKINLAIILFPSERVEVPEPTPGTVPTTKGQSSREKIILSVSTSAGALILLLVMVTVITVGILAWRKCRCAKPGT